jgi:hypothetical protein
MKISSPKAINWTLKQYGYSQAQQGTLHWTGNEKKRSFIFFSLFDLKMGHSANNFFFQ